jgi:hypothetical protein
MKTVKIKPYTAFVNGKRIVATQLNVFSIQDNLFDHVIFKYTLLDDDGLWAGESTYELNGLAEYQTWNTTADNAFEIVAAGIGLEVESVDEAGKVVFLEI